MTFYWGFVGATLDIFFSIAVVLSTYSKVKISVLVLPFSNSQIQACGRSSLLSLPPFSLTHSSLTSFWTVPCFIVVYAPPYSSCNFWYSFFSWIGHGWFFALNKGKRIQGSNSANVRFHALGKDFKIRSTKSEMRNLLVNNF